MLTKKCNFGHSGPFLAPYLASCPLFGVSQKIIFCYTNSLMCIYFHTKVQNGTNRRSPDILRRCYSETSRVFYVWLSTPKIKSEKSGSCCLI